MTITRTPKTENASGRPRRFRRTLWAAALVVALTIAGTGVAVATIPDGGTEVFHGCVTSATGAIRIIDPSKGQSCSGAEQAVTWNGTGIRWHGAWSSTTAYASGDAVSYGGSSYVATSGNTNASPTMSGKWSLLAAQGSPGSDGSTILHGSGAPPSSQGDRGDFYIDTASHILYGPKFQYCHNRHCYIIWPTKGTSLVGPRGPIGPSMVVSTPGGDVTLQSYTDSEIAVLKKVPPGEYSLSANVTIGNDDGSPQDGVCELYVNYTGYLSNSIDDDRITIPAAPPGGSSFSQFSLQGTVYYAGKPGYAILACNTYYGYAYTAHISAVKVGTVIGPLG